MAITEAYSSNIQGLNPDTYLLYNGMAYGPMGDVIPIAVTTTNTNIVPTNIPTQGLMSASAVNDVFDVRNHHAIKGEMLMAQETFSEALLQDSFTDNDIKRAIANKIVDEMLNSGYIEFTKQTEPHTGNTIVRARVFVLPNSDVQILRINGVK